MNLPTESQLRIISEVTRRHIASSLSPLQAYDKAKRELLSAMDIDWYSVRLDTETNQAIQIAPKPAKVDKDWSKGTIFMIADDFPK
jgi:hypothetical protein